MAAISQQSGAPGPAGSSEDEVRRLSIDTIRALAMDAVQKANAGHPGTAMALAPLGYTIVEHHTYVICSDGDMMEGVSQEASSIAGNFGLGKLIVCYDDNHITIDGTTAISFDGENHTARMEADGWHVQRVEDSEDLDAIEAALATARDEPERPSFISIRSHIAYPAPRATDTAKSHGSALGEEEVRRTKEVMGFDPDKHFWVDDRV